MWTTQTVTASTGQKTDIKNKISEHN